VTEGKAVMGEERLSARAVAEAVTDPELPMLTLADLGVLREVTEDGDTVSVAITPTYSGCPAMDTMRDDLVHALHRAGYDEVEVRTVLSPAWSSDWISAAGRRKLAAAGITPAQVERALDPSGYLGAADAFITAALTAHESAASPAARP